MTEPAPTPKRRWWKRQVQGNTLLHSTYVQGKTAGMEVGHLHGFSAGRDQGVSIGYLDAKTRAFLAVDSLWDSRSQGATITKADVTSALTQMLGREA